MKKIILNKLSILIIGIILINSACQPLEIIRVAKVKTGDVSDIGYFKATAEGLIVDLSDDTRELGHCWDTLSEPDVNKNKLAMDGNYSQGSKILTEMTYLKPDHTYYLRAYAITGKETVYGEETNFKTNKLPNYTVNLLVPVTDGLWPVGKQKTIKWETDMPGTFTLTLLQQEGTNFIDVEEIATTAEGARALDYTLPSNLVAGNRYAIKIKNTELEDFYDFKTFKATDPAISMIQPNANTKWNIGRDYDITWQSTDVDRVDIKLYKEGNWVSDIADAQLNTNDKQPWRPEATLTPGTGYQIKINYAAFPEFNATSDNFEILPEAYINISAPATGNIWQMGSTHDITWADNIEENVKIVLKRAGAYLRDINLNTESDGSYSWTLPTDLTAGIQYSIAITSVDDPLVTKESAQFEISTAAATGSLVAYYPFNGNANDESTNSYNGTVNGATLTTDRFGNANSAYSFDGVDDWINIGSEPGNGIRTISLWFSSDIIIDSNVPDALALIQRDVIGEAGEFGLHFGRYDWSNAGQLSFGRTVGSTGSGIVSDDNIWQANNWVHVIGSIDPQNGMKLYVNSVLQASTDASTGPTDTRSEVTAIGQWGVSNNSGRFFDGKIDDIRIYDYALTNTEIQNLYTEGGWQGYETGTVTDYDNNTYNTVKIGNQWWMAENLKVTKYADGSEIDLSKPAPATYTDAEWAALGDNNTDKAYCYYNNNASNEADTYGALYTWAAAMDGNSSSTANPSGIQGVCPTGWHLPSDDEWKELEMYLGITQAQADAIGYRGTNEGSKLAGNAALWTDGVLDNDVEFGTSGFSALPGGNRQRGTGIFDYINTYTDCWSSSENNATEANYRFLNFNNSSIGRGSVGKSYGFSVRCVKD